MLIVTRNGNTVADNYACVVCTYVCVRSGGASPSNQPGHFQVTTVVKQVIPSLPFPFYLFYLPLPFPLISLPFLERMVF